MKLETERLVLRDLTKLDDAPLLKYINSLTISQFTALVPYPYTQKDADWFINHCLEDQAKNPRISYELAITLKPSEELIGVMALTKISHFNGTGTIGYWLAEDFWQKGIASEAAKEILRFGFSELGLRRINIEAATVNIASNNVIKKLGFVFEGVQRQGHKVKSTGKIYDINEYGMLKEEWIALEKESESTK